MSPLEGNVAIVTGGAGGLGAAIAARLGREGVRVAVADLRLPAAEDTAARLREGDIDAMAVELDVGNEAQANDVLARLMERWGRFDILINNAGTDVTLPVEELTVEDWDRVMATNLRGPFVMSRLAMAAMKLQGGGSIVNIVSTAAKRAWANASVYHASKWGLLGLSHALHVEGRPHSVKVTAVVAGGMRTPFLLDRFPDLDPGLLQDPENVAETVRFVLCQPAETVIPEVMVLPLKETSWP